MCLQFGLLLIITIKEITLTISDKKLQEFHVICNLAGYTDILATTANIFRTKL